MAQNILVSVGQMAPEETLAAFVDRQVDDVRGHARGFQLRSRRDARLDGEAGTEIVFSWHEGDGPIRQRQVYARRPGERVVSVMHTARDTDFAGCDGVFTEMLRDFAWSKPEEITQSEINRAPRP
jgi:hypothetical protein